MPNKFIALVLGVLLIGFIGINLYFIYALSRLNDIENFLRYSVMALALIIIFISVLTYLNIVIKNKLIRYFFFLFIILIIAIIEVFAIININKIFSSINKIHNEYVTYSTSLITLNSSPINNIKDFKNKKIGIINDKKNIEGYIISQDIIKENKLTEGNTLVEYDDFLYMLNDLYGKEIDAMFVSTNYKIMFSSIDHFENIGNEVKAITVKNKKMTKQSTIGSGSTKKITEPFTILIMGVDSEHEGLDKNAAFNGDALMLVTFNPTTLNATILSIPRDTYVPIMCFKNHIENKITHAAWYGESCMSRTIENFTGITIDYYVKVNFKGVVKLVDALGGVAVDVPYSFCEQNSNRQFGKNTIYVKKGLQTLNGEQALAFARNRKSHSDLCASQWTKSPRNDFIRGQNQQLVIKAIMNKAKSMNSLNQVYSLLDTISSNIDTNIDTNQILQFYNVGKDIMAKSKNNTDSDLIAMQRLYLSGYDFTIYDEGMRLPLYNYIYYKASLKEIVDAMEINLGVKSPTVSKNFSFSINKPYTTPIIGKGTYTNDHPIPITPNFTRNTKAYAESWGIKNNVKINFITIGPGDTGYSSTYQDGQIIYQSVPQYYKVASINKTDGITLKIIEKPDTPTEINCELDENDDNPSCLIPDMIGWTIEEFNTWDNKRPGSFIANPIKVDTVDPTQNGKIFEQSHEKGTKIADIAALTVKYYSLVEEVPLE
jgi:LCP family protein required for cell wall assembly